MQLTINDQQVDLSPSDQFSSIPNTAMNLYNSFQPVKNTKIENKSNTQVIVTMDKSTNLISIKGITCPAKIYSSSGKLLRIASAKGGEANFNIKPLKKGKYILEVNHQLIEFVR